MDFDAYWADLLDDRMKLRKKWLLHKFDPKKLGLEISPLYSPITDKNIHNVEYTDYTSAEESRRKHADYPHDEIMDLNFIWDQDLPLHGCAGGKGKYHWAIASHVLEHVPNPIGWMNEILDVICDGGYLSLALPDPSVTNDLLRETTKFHHALDAWMNQYTIPSTFQLYDFVRNTTSQGVTAVASPRERHYPPQEALSFCMHSWKTGEYIDAHCNVFTPLSFEDMINEANMHGIMNVEIDDIGSGNREFYVRLRKLGPVLVLPPIRDRISTVDESKTELNHYKKAFKESIDVQETLKSEIERLRSRGLLRRIFNR